MAKGVKTGGRIAGTPNKATADLKGLAREYTQEALDGLVRVLRSSESDQARVAAANSILDRGYGKASQVLSGDEDGGPIKTITRIELVAPELVDSEG